ncbi:MAG: tRNA (adenosine(37)-N6)-threonylcarbamoyltransferase complex dimerization subunit type 1 TsaB [Anaerolineales bacterium]
MLLAIDTSTAQVGLALYDDQRLHAETLWSANAHHTTQLAPAIQDLLARCGATMQAVSAVAIALGPGSFTSLRVGLSLAKGLALARQIPLLGIPTLDILAAAQPTGEHPLLAVIAAGRRRLAYQEYASAEGAWQARGSAQSAVFDELLNSLDRPTYLAGEFSPEERQRLLRKKSLAFLAPLSRCARRPALLAELAWARLQNNESDAPAALAPIYLHTEGTPIA